MPQVLKLFGVVGSVDEKKIIIGGHCDTMDRLRKMATPAHGKHPLLDGNKVQILLSANVQLVANPRGKVIKDLKDLNGSKVIIRAAVRKYSFKSQFIRNRGEQIMGWNLCAVSIEQAL